MMRTTTMVGMVALVLLAEAGCKDDPNPCDSTTYYDGASCMPKQDAGPTLDLAAAEADQPAVDTGGGEANGSSTSLLGVPCTSSGASPECQGPDTDYCAIQPGNPGYCTKSGCATDADCPADWTCFDLSKMGITGYPPMCTKPRS
jgi:hypothetical protein